MRKATRQKSALVWLAILTIASVAGVRAEGVTSSPSPYTQSMLRLLAAHHGSEALAAGVPGFFDRFSAGYFARTSPESTHRTQSALWLSMLPVVFVGLAAPLSTLVLRSHPLQFGAITTFLPSCYRRPPPEQLG